MLFPFTFEGMQCIEMLDPTSSKVTSCNFMWLRSVISRSVRLHKPFFMKGAIILIIEEDIFAFVIYLVILSERECGVVFPWTYSRWFVGLSVKVAVLATRINIPVFVFSYFFWYNFSSILVPSANMKGVVRSGIC